MNKNKDEFWAYLALDFIVVIFIMVFLVMVWFVLRLVWNIMWALIGFIAFCIGYGMTSWFMQ